MPLQKEKIERVFVGLDLGKKRDPSAAVTIEQVQNYAMETKNRVITPQDRPEREGPPFYRVQHIERPPLGTDYDVVRERIAQMMENIEKHYDIKPQLVIDAGGVGSVVFDEFKNMDIRPIGIVFSSGYKASEIENRVFSVPKMDLASRLEILTLNGRFAINENIPLANVLKKELQTFTAKMSDKGNMTVEHEKITDHDDLVFACCMPLWYAEYYYGRRIRSIPKSMLNL